MFLLQTKVQILSMLPGCQHLLALHLLALPTLPNSSHNTLSSLPQPHRLVLVSLAVKPLLASAFVYAVFFCLECTPSSPINHACPGGSCFFILQFSASPTAPNTQTLRMGPATAVREFTPSVFLFHSDTFLCASLRQLSTGLQPRPFQCSPCLE